MKYKIIGELEVLKPFSSRQKIAFHGTMILTESSVQIKPIRYTLHFSQKFCSSAALRKYYFSILPQGNRLKALAPMSGMYTSVKLSLDQPISSYLSKLNIISFKLNLNCSGFILHYCTVWKFCKQAMENLDCQRMPFYIFFVCDDLIRNLN